MPSSTVSKFSSTGQDDTDRSHTAQMLIDHRIVILMAGQGLLLRQLIR